MTRFALHRSNLFGSFPDLQSHRAQTKKHSIARWMTWPMPRIIFKSITIHQEIEFTVSPQQLYEALLDSKQFTEFSGRAAEINREVGVAFSLFKGHIIGRNLELVPNQRIVQGWRVVTWPKGAYSIARFELKPQGSGPDVVLDHIGFPEGLHDHLAQGWEENYWSLLKKYFP